MENVEWVTELHPPPTNNGQAGEMAVRPDAAAVQRRRAAQSIEPIPVSRSSYLYEMDRYYRAAMTVKNSVELAGQAMDGIVYLDRKAHRAAEERVSERSQAIIERTIDVVGHTTGLVVFGFGSSDQD